MKICEFCLNDPAVDCVVCRQGPSQAPIWQVYRCGHPNCGAFYIKSERRWPFIPHCPTRIESESESESRHPVEYVGAATYKQIQQCEGPLDSHVRYTCTEDGACSKCCEFICRGSSEVICPNCGCEILDAYQQQNDPQRWIQATPVEQSTTAEIERLRKRISMMTQLVRGTEAV